MSRASAIEQARVAIQGRDFTRLDEIIAILLKQGDTRTASQILMACPIE